MTTFNPETGELTWEDGSTRLSRQRSDVLAALARANGRVVERDWLIEQVIGEGRHPSHLNVVVCAIRARLLAAKAPVSIENAKGRGFWLSAPVKITDATTVQVSAEDRRALRRLVQTHHDSTLAGRVHRALGDLM